MIGVSSLCPPPHTPKPAENEGYKKQSFTLKTEANVLSWVCCQEKKIRYVSLITVKFFSPLRRLHSVSWPSHGFLF